MPVKLIAGRVHMEEYLRGWRDEEDVILPPLENRGFLDTVIIREPVEPINTELSEKAVILDEKESENKTVLLSKPVIKTRASVQLAGPLTRQPHGKGDGAFRFMATYGSLGLRDTGRV